MTIRIDYTPAGSNDAQLGDLCEDALLETPTESSFVLVAEENHKSLFGLDVVVDDNGNPVEYTLGHWPDDEWVPLAHFTPTPAVP